jgi:predicted DNA-binding transcriptional regulator AlpA
MLNRAGVYGGSRVGYFEHEVSNWLRARARANTGEPAAPALPMPDHPKIISVREAEDRTGFSRVHLWRLEQAGRFPQRVRLGEAAAAA